MSYSKAETRTHVEHCKRCGAELEVDWCEITAWGDPEPTYVIGRADCPTEGCGTTCPICRRRPGDVHSGACGPVMDRKLVDKVHVTTADCMAEVAA
jgi:hypothetical protein